ncbi:MAG: peptidylprolyl isomerase [Gammaproteobacteria bacterium]|nr:peptidylprolyl isomerase [Gammaproteobacteria bacterium]
MRGVVKAGLVVLLVLWQVAAYAKPDAKATAKENDAFAVVDGEQISKHDFRMAYQAGVRKRFYHGKIPEQQLEAFKQEVSDTLIERLLLLREAKKQKITADAKSVESQLKTYEKRYASRPDWERNREGMLAGLRAALEEENLLEQLRQRVQEIGVPNEKEAQKFYDGNRELFTTPMQRRVSLILLKVAPSSGADVWQAASDEAQKLVKRLRSGADFADAARIHSGDPSASNGGDMGFLHQGMLSPQAEKVLNGMKENEISDPVMMLQGVAILRLDETLDAQLNEYEKVKDRVRQLWQRERAKQAWADLLRNLKSRATITIDMAGL